MLLPSGCSSSPAINSVCSLTQITPDAGFQTRWTHDEKAQVEALDEKLDAACKGK